MARSVWLTEDRAAVRSLPQPYTIATRSDSTNRSFYQSLSLISLRASVNVKHHDELSLLSAAAELRH